MMRHCHHIYLRIMNLRIFQIQSLRFGVQNICPRHSSGSKDALGEISRTQNIFKYIQQICRSVDPRERWWQWECLLPNINIPSVYTLDSRFHCDIGWGIEGAQFINPRHLSTWLMTWNNFWRSNYLESIIKGIQYTLEVMGYKPRSQILFFPNSTQHFGLWLKFWYSWTTREISLRFATQSQLSAAWAVFPQIPRMPHPFWYSEGNPWNLGFYHTFLTHDGKIIDTSLPYREAE